MKIYIATWLAEISQKESLDKVGKAERLLSYYHITATPAKLTFEEYIHDTEKSDKVEKGQGDLSEEDSDSVPRAPRRRRRQT